MSVTNKFDEAIQETPFGLMSLYPRHHQYDGWDDLIEEPVQLE